MTPQEIQSAIDRIRLLITQLGWTMTKSDITGPEIIIELRRPKDK